MPNTIDVHRPTPSCSLASSRSNTSVPSRTTKSIPSRCSTLFRKTWNGRWTSAGKADEGCSARLVAHVHRMPPTVRPKLLVIAGVLVTPLVTAATALAGNGGFAPVAPESPNAHAIKQSYLFISLFAFAIFLLVEGLLIAFVIRYRRRKRPREADGAQIHGANKLELAWTVGPVLILAVIAHLRLRQAAHDPGRARLGGDVTEPRGRRHRHAVHVAVPLPERRRDDRPHARPRGSDGRAPHHLARLGRHPLLVDPGTRRKDGRDPREAQQDVVQGDARRRVPGPVRRALRPLPREDARRGRGDAGGRVRLVVRGAARPAGGRHVAARRGALGRHLREVPRPRGRGRLRPAHRRDRPDQEHAVDRGPPAQGRHPDAARRTRLDDRPR